MTESDDPRGTDRRRHARTAVKVYSDLYWEGIIRQLTFDRAQCVSVSANGLRLKLTGGRLKTGTSVNVRIDRFGFSEYGVVRYVLPQGFVGVEFRFETADKVQHERWNRLVSTVQQTSSSRAS